MKKILLLLISILAVHSFNIKAALREGEIQRVYDEGKKIQEVLETRLALEFKKQSDDILNKINPAYLKAEEDYRYIFSKEANNKEIQAKTRSISTELQESMILLNKNFLNDLQKITNPNCNLDINESVNSGWAEFQKLALPKLLSAFNNMRNINTQVADSNIELAQIKERVSKIVSFDDLAKARMQANSQVNLNTVLLYVVDNALLNSINKFWVDSETAISNLINNGGAPAFVTSPDGRKVISREITNYLDKVKFPHSELIKEAVNKYYFSHIPKFAIRDRIICPHCKAEAQGLQTTDLLQYYHLDNCSLLAKEKIKIDQNTDSKLTVQQRIRAFGRQWLNNHSDSDSNEPIIHETLEKYLPENIIGLISAYSDLREKRFKAVVNLYSGMGQLAIWLVVYQYVIDHS